MIEQPKLSLDLHIGAWPGRLEFKLQIWPLCIMYPVKTSGYHFDLSRHGLIQIKRLWVDW